MKDSEFVQSVMKMYPQINIYESDSYDINVRQLKRLVDVIEFFSSQDWFESYKPIELYPSMLHGWVSIKFSLFHITDHDIKRFCDVIQYASSFSVDPYNDGTLEVGVTIPDIYRKKKLTVVHTDKTT